MCLFFKNVYKLDPMKLFLPKIKIEIAIPDDMVDQVKNAIIEAAGSGKIGDGKIFISPIEEVVRIRTGETNEEAL